MEKLEVLYNIEILSESAIKSENTLKIFSKYFTFNGRKTACYIGSNHRLENEK